MEREERTQQAALLLACGRTQGPGTTPHRRLCRCCSFLFLSSRGEAKLRRRREEHSQKNSQPDGGCCRCCYCCCCYRCFALAVTSSPWMRVAASGKYTAFSGQGGWMGSVWYRTSLFYDDSKYRASQKTCRIKCGKTKKYRTHGDGFTFSFMATLDSRQ